MDKHDIVARVKQFFHENGKNPTRADMWDIGINDYQVRKNGSVRGILEMAGLSDVEFSPQEKVKITNDIF